MVPIPPPPGYEPAVTPPPPPPPGPVLGRANPRPGQLTLGWRWVLTLGWVAVVVGLSAVTDSVRILHKPPFWYGHGVLVALPFVLPTVAALSAFANHRLAVWIGWGAVGELALLAVIDRRTTPGVAAALGVLALIGALTTGSAMAGRMPGATAGERSRSAPPI